MNQERLQKVLARAGIASRRHAEQLIVDGHVRVNGRLATELGLRVDAHEDKIEVDGRRIVLEQPVYAILHKPRGVVTTLSDPEGRPTIAELVQSLDARVFPVGRLDFHTSGALLVTNDGELSQALLHPRHHVPKVYVAKVRGVPTDAQLDAWRNGVMLYPTESDPDEKPMKTKPAEVHVLRLAPPGEDSTTGAGATWLQVTLREGRTRQIHRMADATGLFVMRLIRMSFAGITTEGLRPGELRELTDKEVTALRVSFLRPIESGAFDGPAPDEAAAAKKRPARKPAVKRVAPVFDDHGNEVEAPKQKRAPSFLRAAKPEGDAPKREGGFARAPRAEGTERSFSRGPKRDGDAPKREGGFARGPKPEGGFSRGPKRDGDAPKREGGFSRGPKPEGAERSFSRGPKPEGGFSRGPKRDGDAPKREGGFSRGPKSEGTERSFSRGPKREGDSPKREGGFSRGPRPEGSERSFSRAPRAEGAERSFSRGPKRDGDAPKREGGFARGPKPEGGFSRGPKREGDAPKREGGFSRGPKPEGGFSRGPKRDGNAPKREGGFARGPKPEGGFSRGPKPEGGFSRGPKREGDAPKREGSFSRGPKPEGGFAPRGPKRDDDAPKRDERRPAPRGKTRR